jgi:hypothetical protein
MNRYLATCALILLAIPAAAHQPAGLWEAVVTVPLNNTPTEVFCRIFLHRVVGQREITQSVVLQR